MLMWFCLVMGLSSEVYNFEIRKKYGFKSVYLNQSKEMFEHSTDIKVAMFQSPLYPLVFYFP